MIYKSTGNCPLNTYDLWIGWKPASVYLRFTNRLETGLRLYMIYKLIENWLLYVYDLYFDYRLASVYAWFMKRLETGVRTSMIYELFFLLDSHPFIPEKFEEKPLNNPK